MNNNKYREIGKKEMKIWLENVRKEWEADHQGCENYCKLIEKKYGGNYDYYCMQSRHFFGNPIKRSGSWLWKN